MAKRKPPVQSVLLKGRPTDPQIYLEATRAAKFAQGAAWNAKAVQARAGVMTVPEMIAAHQAKARQEHVSASRIVRPQTAALDALLHPPVPALDSLTGRPKGPIVDVGLPRTPRNPRAPKAGLSKPKKPAVAVRPAVVPEPPHDTTTAPVSVTHALPATSEKPPTKPQGRQRQGRQPQGPAVAGQQPVPVAAQVAALQASQYQQINAEQARQATADQARQAAFQQFAQAMIGQLQGLPSQVTGDYQNAQAATDKYAQTAAAGLVAANPNQADQALLSAINAPQSQHDQLANQNANVFGGGAAVLYDTRGAIPATALAANQAAAVGYARSLPAIQGLAATQGLRSLLAKQAEGQQKYADARGTLRAQTPALSLQIQGQQATQAARQQALEQNAVALGIKNASLGIKNADSRFRQSLSVAQLKQKQLQGDRGYQLGLDRLGISEEGLRLKAVALDAKLKADSRGGGFTTSQKLGLRKRAGAIAEEAFQGIPVKEHGKVIGYHNRTYQSAIKKGIAAEIPLALIQASLNVYWKPGENKPWEADVLPDGTPNPQANQGRPVMSFQERKAHKRA